jgi:hypothetical protein
MKKRRTELSLWPMKLTQAWSNWPFAGGLAARNCWSELVEAWFA